MLQVVQNTTENNVSRVRIENKRSVGMSQIFAVNLVLTNSILNHAIRMFTFISVPVFNHFLLFSVRLATVLCTLPVSRS